MRVRWPINKLYTLVIFRADCMMSSSAGSGINSTKAALKWLLPWKFGMHSIQKRIENDHAIYISNWLLASLEMCVSQWLLVESNGIRT